MTRPQPFEIYAVRYGRRDANRNDHFIFRDPHDAPMPMDYFVWAVIGPAGTFVVDIGYGQAEGERRGRTFLRCPSEGLRVVGVEASEVKDLIVTHMHYDHVGNLDKFPNATIHIQDAELEYTTGRSMCHPVLRSSFNVDDVVDMVRLVYADRVRFHDGEAELAPGLTIHHVGGHTRGLQVVRVWTGRGWVVLASDASHYYEHLEKRSPFIIVENVSAMLEAFDTLERLADSRDHIIPGHDPLVMERYPAPSKEAEGIAVRLDVAPAA